MLSTDTAISARTVSDSLGRRGRLLPRATGKRVSLQERDLLWLQKMHEHGPLPSSFLLAFAKDHGASAKRATERLTDLFNEDNTVHGGAYLARPPQQFATIDSRYNQLVYDLAPAGLKALKERGLWQETSAARSGPWLHRFMVSSIMASIELAVRERSDLRYIPQADILKRAKTELRYPVTIEEPGSRRPLTKDLISDALFGLEYRTSEGNRYRFFVVEADRGTEPAVSGNWNRKSALRNLLQYQRYVAGGLYKDHLRLTSPLLVLTLCSNAVQMQRLIHLAERECPGGCAYLLYLSWVAFDTPWRPPQPNEELLTGQWRRAGKELLRIDEV